MHLRWVVLMTDDQRTIPDGPPLIGGIDYTLGERYPADDMADYCNRCGRPHQEGQCQR